MARKKPEAIETLEKLTSRPKCGRCDEEAIARVDNEYLCEAHYVTRQDGEARQRFADLGLERAPGESQVAWRKRVIAHIKSNIKVKTFADAAKAEDEWAA
jgi:hypothetical protein